MHWQIPAPLETARVRTAGGSQVILRRHGNPAGPRILLTHGNGLAADLCYPYWSLLADRYDLVLYDLRSHGWNPVGDLLAQNFPTLVGDNGYVARAVGRHFGEKPMVGIYHSVSALVALCDALREKAEFSALVLFDLPICPPGGTPEDLEESLGRVAARTRKRQGWFESRAHFVEQIRRARTFERLRPGVAELFAETTLRPAANGGYELRCPIEHEAVIYEYGFGWAMQTQLALEQVALRCPVKAIGSDPTVPYSFLPGMDLHLLTKLNYDFLPDTTHFLLLENPEECAALTMEFLDRSGVA